MACFSSLRIATYEAGEMPPHCHDHPSLGLPLGGNYSELTRGRRTEHELGCIHLCPQGEVHSQVFHRRVTKLLIHPNPEMIDYLGGFVPVAEAPYARSPQFGALGLRLAEELRRSDPQSHLIADGVAMEVIGLFARADERETATARWLEVAREYVRGHTDAPIRLADVAGFVGCRPARLAAAYRRTFGCTIGEDARALRLQRAALRLASTAEPIAQIAAECGFYDQAHFTRLFRKAYGMPPLAYRRRLH